MAGALLVGVVCVWLSVRGVDVAGLRAELSAFSLPLVLLATACVVFVAAGKALRWQWLYGIAGSTRSWPTHFGVLMIGQMLNLVIPVRLGEIARIGLMRQEERPVAVTFGTIVAEKALDLSAVGLIVLLVVPAVLVPPALRLRFGAGGLMIGGVLLLALIAFGRLQGPIAAAFSRLTDRQSGRPGRMLRWARNSAMAVATSMASLKGMQLVRVGMLTAGIWLVSLLTVQVTLRAFNLDLGWGAPLALMLALTSSNWAPTPPAMIGVVSAVTVAVLAAFGVDQTRSIALGAVLNAVLVGPPIFLGSTALSVRLWRIGETVNLRSLRRAAGLIGDEAAPDENAREGSDARR